MGHRIDAEGIHPSGETLSAVRDAPAPTNITELRSYLGMVNHYGRFLPNLATMLAPVAEERHQVVLEEDSTRGLQQDEEMLSSPQVMTHFDSSKPLVLTCDASPYGIGSVLAHVMEYGAEKPISYHSRSLSHAEKNYAQIDKEGLSVIVGLKKFHQYLWGHKFNIVTDHKLGLDCLEKRKPFHRCCRHGCSDGP